MKIETKLDWTYIDQRIEHFENMGDCDKKTIDLWKKLKNTNLIHFNYPTPVNIPYSFSENISPRENPPRFQYEFICYYYSLVDAMYRDYDFILSPEFFRGDFNNPQDIHLFYITKQKAREVNRIFKKVEKKRGETPYY